MEGETKRMRKRLITRIASAAMATVLSVTGMILSMPVNAYAAEEPKLPSVTTFATPDQLKDTNNFAMYSKNLRRTGVAQKVNFGNGITWYIAGADTDGSLVLMCQPFGDVFCTMRFSFSIGGKRQYNGKEVYVNHYGASDVRIYLTGSDEQNGDGDYALEKFTTAEQALMKETTVYTYDMENDEIYSTSDKLYLPYGHEYHDLSDSTAERWVIVGANSSDDLYSGIKVGIANDNYTEGSPYHNCTDDRDFWLRRPIKDPYSLLVGNPNRHANTIDNNLDVDVAVVPAFNLDLSSVLFASTAPVASPNPSLGDAMNFRINAGDKIQSTAEYNSNQINVRKGTDSENLYLYVQGKDSNGDWIWSEQVTSNSSYNVADIHSGLTSTTNCKVWLETTNGSDNLAYAKMAKEIHSVTVSVDDDAMGSASANPATAISGETITLTATASNGYEFDHWESEDVTVENNCFQIPDKNVNVKAVFKPKYSITVSNDGNGTAGAKVNGSPVSEATEGTEVAFSVTPNANYVFEEWEVVSGEITITNNSFIMPSTAVEVMAKFKYIEPDKYSISFNSDGHGTVDVSTYEAIENEDVTLSAKAFRGYSFDYWETSPAVVITDNKFSMPAEAVTITAHFKKNPTPNSETYYKPYELTPEEMSEEMQKAIEELVSAEMALPTTEFTFEEALNRIPMAAKNQGAAYNLSKLVTTQGFASAVTKIAANVKSQTANTKGTTVVVYTDRPMTFCAEILDAIYAADINFEYVFRYEGKLYKISIPRGVKVDLGGSRYEGPLYVGKILGTTKVIEE